MVARMNNIPGEGSPAGDALAIMMATAPVLAIVIGATLKPKIFAFFGAVAASGAVIAYGVTYALNMAPGPGTELAAGVFGSVGGGLALFMAIATAGGRALLGRSPMSTTVVGNVHDREAAPKL